jgi:hypothetical protein
MTLLHWNHVTGAPDVGQGFAHSVQKDSSSSVQQSTALTVLFSYLGFSDVSWLSLNNLLHLAGLACASTSASIATFTGVPAETALSFVFRLRLSPSASAFGKTWFLQGLHETE